MLAALAPFVDYAATIERPLFSPSRRPEAAAAAPNASGIASRYRLQGLVIAGTTRHALVTEIAGGHTQELGEGDALEGWTVTRIEQDRVTLTSPAGEATLALPRADPAKR
jgi:type II secretory pathway component PulC